MTLILLKWVSHTFTSVTIQNNFNKQEYLSQTNVMLPNLAQFIFHEFRIRFYRRAFLFFKLEMQGLRSETYYLITLFLVADSRKNQRIVITGPPKYDRVGWVVICLDTLLC